MNKNFARTKYKIQFPFFLNDSLEILFEKLNFNFENENFKITILTKPLLIGIANVKLNLYSKYASPLTTYYGIEILKKSKAEMSIDEATKLLKSFILEFNQATNMIIEISELHDFDSDYYGYEEEEEEEENLENPSSTINISELPNYSEAIEFYLKAQSTSDDEIKFLYYYKIIEYFSPKVAKLKAYEVLVKKLDSIKYKNTKSSDLDTIIDISESLRKSKSDSELAKTVLSTGIDIIDLFDLLPENTRKLICKNIGINSNTVDYNLSIDKIESISQSLGKILYSTRNSIVHAKSNYTPDSFECKTEDLSQMNTFLYKATYQVLKWNDNLPKHSK
ncbi:MAG: hypothetical protein H7Y10_16335 [Flavobacterium sp.]|nr:hypothetical protein [Flavobacterium sp.]